jgi:hypothetical protein
MVGKQEVGTWTSSRLCVQLVSRKRARTLFAAKPVIHPEHVPEAIRIPLAPDASASTLPARAPALIAVRTLIVRLMSYCPRKPIS